MREALIVWGGWSGHEPEQGAHIVAGMLEEEGFKVYVENTTEAFADPAIADMSLIVPIYTMSKIEKEELDNLEKAVRGGVGLAGYHGGMCDAFRDAVDYQFMCGGQWVAHPGNIIDYRVNIVKRDDPIMAGHRRLRLPLRAVLHARRSRRTRCWRRPPSPASTRRGSTASSCRWCGSAVTARAASSIPRSATSRRSSRCREMRTILKRGLLWAAR